MSMFRAYHVLNPSFIRTVEADYLDHWLWGRFRFLSGDDKSTWYYLLTQKAKMTYVPDAQVYTIEVIEGNGYKRMVANLRRWSGNMLRNGARAIALGPRTVGPFIWWCLIDQRIAIWTTLVSPVLAFYGSMIVPSYALSAILWILATRMILSIFLFRYARSFDATWPILLYVNQVVNAVVKVFMSFRLARQNWANRGNQTSGVSSGFAGVIKRTIANAQMFTAVSALLWGLALWTGVV
jgi:glycosyltransferase Alg8